MVAFYFYQISKLNVKGKKMSEGQVLLLTIALVLVAAFLTNALVWVVLP